MTDLSPREPTGRTSPKEGVKLLGDWFAASTLAAQGRLAEAAVMLEAVLLPLDPENRAFITRLAELRRRLGDRDRSYELLRRAQQLYPEDSEILQLLGQLEMDRRNFPEALELLHAANQLSPGSLHGLYLEALASGRVGDHERSAELYLEALAIDGSHRDSLINLGSALAQIGDLEGARESLAAAREMAPWNARTHYLIGLVERMSDRPEASRVAFERALELRERYPEAQLALAATLIEVGEVERGREELLRVQEEYPGSSAAERASTLLEDL